MNKRFELIEKIKTVILVVLFFITILLLYLCFNQHGKSFTLSEIFPGGRTGVTSVNENDYILPEYALQSNGDSTFAIAFENKNAIYSATEDSMAGLLASAAASITESTAEEFEKAALSKDSIQVVFDFDVPFDDFCLKVIDSTLEKPATLKGFKAVLFNDQEKECFYIRDSQNRCFKMTAGENYYAIERFSKCLESESKVLNHFANFYDVNKILASYNLLPVVTKYELDGDEIAENIFSDTFDFVRKITDSFGNETFMYGYGQKRLTIKTDGSMEFKAEISEQTEANFYNDLQVALSFIENTIGLNDRNYKIKNVSLVKDNENTYYKFTFSDGTYSITTNVNGQKVSYFYLEEENMGAIWIGRALKAY